MTTPVQPSKAEQFTLGVGPRFQHVSSYGPGGLNELDLSNVNPGHIATTAGNHEGPADIGSGVR
jgi:hypothetical protein